MVEVSSLICRLNLLSFAVYISGSKYPFFLSRLDRKEILGELQFAFVCFLVGQGMNVAGKTITVVGSLL